MKQFKINKKYSCCRSCKNDDLLQFFSIKNLPMPEGHVGKDEVEYFNDIYLYVCKKCFLVQTQEDLYLDDYYSNYVYTTSNSSHVLSYMKLLANKLTDEKYVIPGNKVLEIGSGDGEQLLQFKNRGMECIGVEPSKSLAREATSKGINTIISMFDSHSAEKIINEYGKFDAIIIQYTFDHLTNPSEFLEAASLMLNENGILFIEVHDFEKIFVRNEACLFTHEHSIYPSKYSMNNMLGLNNLKVIDYDFIHESDKRGNSMTILASPVKSIHKEAILSLNNELKKLKTLNAYKLFSDKIYESHHRLKEYIKSKNNQKLKVAGYGAAGRGVDTCVIAGINANDLIAVYDQNEFFHNKEMPVSRIIVKEPKSLFSDMPDELIVFSYGYIEEIKEFYLTANKTKIIPLLDIIK